MIFHENQEAVSLSQAAGKATCRISITNDYGWTVYAEAEKPVASNLTITGRISSVNQETGRPHNEPFEVSIRAGQTRSSGISKLTLEDGVGITLVTPSSDSTYVYTW